jgi:hypothetical protein
MPNSWIQALNTYSYPVNLCHYEKANKFPRFFNRTIVGDRNSTMDFEKQYQMKAPNNTASFFEVVFWKLYSQQNIRQGHTNRIVDFVQKNRIMPDKLWDVIQRFVASQSITNLERIRQLLGIKTNVLAVPLTLPALACPERIPMIDRQVAKWVNQNAINHNINRDCQLTPFKMNYTSLMQNDFSNYLNWVSWCQEVADVLSELTIMEWRPRDVEMAVFTAQRNGIILNVLP